MTQCTRNVLRNPEVIGLSIEFSSILTGINTVYYPTNICGCDII
jgi:hypothetical protein